MNNDSDPLPAAFESWQFAADTSAPGLSYGLDTTPDEHIPVWRKDLSADPEVAAAELAAGEALTQASMEELDAVPGRIDDLPSGRSSIFAPRRRAPVGFPSSYRQPRPSPSRKPSCSICLAPSTAPPSALVLPWAEKSRVRSKTPLTSSVPI